MLKAISDRIIVRLAKKSQAKILLNDEKYYTDRGIVESVGEQVCGIKVGDKVVFHLFDELPLPEEGLVVIRQKSLLGMWE